MTEVRRGGVGGRVVFGLLRGGVLGEGCAYFGILRQTPGRTKGALGPPWSGYVVDPLFDLFCAPPREPPPDILNSTPRGRSAPGSAGAATGTWPLHISVALGSSHTTADNLKGPTVGDLCWAKR